MQVTLRPGKDKFLRRGHPWIFRDLIERVEGQPGIGDAVIVRSAEGEVLGQGLYHSSSWIQVRFLTTDVERSVDEVLEERLRTAIATREQWWGAGCTARLVNSESDGIPGTVIDRFGDVLAWSTICAGIERRRARLLEILEEVCSPRAIVQRDDQWLREKDGLDPERGVLRGTLPDRVRIREDDVEFDVDVLNGPKTGFFLDQRFHRLAIRAFARDQDVLDAFCADGGFGLHAAKAGARRVLALDVSEPALERAQHNAVINRVQDRMEFHCADLLDRMPQLRQEGARFGLIVLDPPSFARGKRDADNALRAYQLLNIEALRMLDPGGVLATSSCSSAVDAKEFHKMVLYSARKAGAHLRILDQRSQPPDHPILPAMPETRYLEFLVVQKAAQF